MSSSELICTAYQYAIEERDCKTGHLNHTEAKWIFIYICGKRSEYPEDYYGNSKEPTHREGSGTDFNRTKC